MSGIRDQISNDRGYILKLGEMIILYDDISEIYYKFANFAKNRGIKEIEQPCLYICRALALCRIKQNHNC